MIRVLIADDQALFREGLRITLTAQRLEIVGEAANGEEAVELATELAPDVVLMDLRMPVLDGVAATRRIAALPRAPRVIVLTTFDDDESVFDAVRAGALGYLLKDTRSAKLVEAIDLAARGESFLQPSVAAKLVGEFARIAAPSRRNLVAELGLSEREVAVLRVLAGGASNKEIAVALGIAEGTVKNHVTGIFTKLKVQDRMQAALKARDLGLGQPLPRGDRVMPRG
jgi:DNA-binding NarL/FixJ family response regulator